MPGPWLPTLAWRGRILSLTTIATPHLGSAIADFAKLAWSAGSTPSWRSSESTTGGFLDVTPAAAAEFNRRTPLPDWLPTFSIAGDPPEDEVCWPLRRLYHALLELEGPNDGLVSVASATAFGQSLPSWPLDHFRQMNWLSPEIPTPDTPRVAHYYAEAVANLAGLGFGAAEDSGSAREEVSGRIGWNVRPGSA